MPDTSSPKSDTAGLLDLGPVARQRVELGAQAGAARISGPAVRRLAALLLSALVIALVTYLVPALSRFEPVARGSGYVPFWNVVGRELLGQGRDREREARELRVAEAYVATATIAPPGAHRPAQVVSPSATGHSVFPPFVNGDAELPAVAVHIEHPEALDYYYKKLFLVDLGAKLVVRAAQFGDSALGDDGLSGAIRDRLQTRFGDAGHGFIVLTRYNVAFVHRGIRFSDRGGWFRCEIIFHCESDGHYGFGGVSSYSNGKGLSAFRTVAEGNGSRASHFELWYAKQPEGGAFQIKVDGKLARLVDTDAGALSDAVESLDVADGPHTFQIRSIGSGPARGYGVVLERAGPGVVWDSLGLIGSLTRRLDFQDAEHIRGQVARRDSDLLVFFMGGNDVQREMADLYKTTAPFEAEYTNVIRKYRAGKPDASCLVMSITDHGERFGLHGVRGRRIVPRLVEAQRRVAFAEGCAFYDTLEAMGGSGAIARWYRAKPALAGSDLGHLTVEGHELLADAFYRALLEGYAEFRRRSAGAPFPEWDALRAELRPSGP